MNRQTQQVTAPTKPVASGATGVLQRKCASCGNHTAASGECTDCSKKKSTLQRKLTIGASNDPLEQEADRISEQVMAKPSNTTVRRAPLGIQRFSGQASEQADIAPASVDRVLAGTSSPLETGLRRDMEERFDVDFSRVRIHSGVAAEQSAQEVKAHAYTVGSHIVFGPGQFNGGTTEGRHLIAHELTHVVQQSEMSTNALIDGKPTLVSPLLQREPTRSRATTGKATITDLTTQTVGAMTGQVTAGSLSRREWESLFSRHFTEPDQVEFEVESSHPRYFYSTIYGWIDAQHFFAHIQFAEESGLQGATDKGLGIEGKQQLVRQVIGPDPDDTSIYSDFLEHDLIDASDFIHYREGTFMALAAAMEFLPSQEKALLKGFDDEKLAKVILDNAKSAWSYEDLASNQLGVQFFRLHGVYVNAGKDAAEVRQRFIKKMAEFFAVIQVVDDPAKIKSLGAKLPGKERWKAPKMTKAEAIKKYPELFEFGSGTHRLRIVIHNSQAEAENGKEHIAKVAPSVRELHVEPMKSQFAVYSGTVSRFEAVVLRALLSKAIPINLKSVLIEPVTAKATKP